jgi:hypothetical protein
MVGSNTLQQLTLDFDHKQCSGEGVKKHPLDNSLIFAFSLI